jgi:uncharacterized membrane protein YgdD (TMEM256/DUF423 family)
VTGAMDRAFLVLACALGLLGVALGAFGSHALRARLSPERLGQFETGVRYQLWHALALFPVVLVDSIHVAPMGGWTGFAPLLATRGFDLWSALAGWLFVAGIVLFSGSLYALALTGVRRWGAVTPFGGVCLLLGWLALLAAVVTR